MKESTLRKYISELNRDINFLEAFIKSQPKDSKFIKPNKKLLKNQYKIRGEYIKRLEDIPDNGANSLELISIKNRLNKLNIYYLLVTQNEHESGVVYANSPNYGTLRSFSNYVKAIIKEYFL